MYRRFDTKYRISITIDYFLIFERTRKKQVKKKGHGNRREHAFDNLVVFISKLFFENKIVLIKFR